MRKLSQKLAQYIFGCASIILMLPMQFLHSAELPLIGHGVYFGALQNTIEFGSGDIGSFAMVVPTDLSKAIVIGTYDDQTDGFFDDNVSITAIPNFDPATRLTARIEKSNLNAVAGDNIVGYFISRDSHAGFFDTSAGNSAVYRSILFPIFGDLSAPDNVSGGYYSGTFSGNCSNGARSGEIHSIVPAGFFSLAFITIDDNGVKDGFRENDISLDDAGLLSATTAGGSVFTGAFNFANLSASGTWDNAADGCVGNWAMTRRVEQRLNFPVASAILPPARSVQVGNSAIAFAAIANPYPDIAALECRIASSIPESDAILRYQRTNPIDNMLVGNINTPVDIPASQFQSYVFSLTPQVEIPIMRFGARGTCANTSAFSVFNTIGGLNTFYFTSSVDPVPDILALTTEVDLQLQQNVAQSIAMAAVNLGSASDFTVSIDAPSETFGRLALSLCQTDAAGVCMGAADSSISVNIANGETPTFAIFAIATDAITVNVLRRTLIKFEDSNGVLRGLTSISVSSL